MKLIHLLVEKNKIIFFKLITFILNARLNPLAKNPPKGPIIELNKDIQKA
jgi:hypothetical protein